jgi:AraC family transcriptional regulator
LAKIAVELNRALARRAQEGACGRTTPRVLAEGPGWTVADVLCTSGPRDRPYEEQHSRVSLALVLAGSFQYRGSARRGPTRLELMTPGSLLLGNCGQCFECRHDHGAGDRCLAFWYEPEYFERLAADAGARPADLEFRAFRLPPLRALSPLAAQACATLATPQTGPPVLTSRAGKNPPRLQPQNTLWEEISIQIASQTVLLAGGRTLSAIPDSASAIARVTRAVRLIEENPGANLSLHDLAREARLSPYHFLRVFQEFTGITPHQYVLRLRLREAAVRLAAGPVKVLDVALDSGFGDVSNFNRAFRAEFGASPRAFRAQTTPGTSSATAQIIP